MNERKNFDRVEGIIRNSLKLKNFSISMETQLKDIDGWDSLQHVVIIAEVEKSFGIQIDFLELLEIQSVGDICRAVSKHLDS